MCEFLRTLHPVGHGAFFTEYIGCAGKSYNVVYDCGSLSKKILEKEIGEYFCTEEKKHIDLIFISHFDYDHINGLYFLVERGLITEETFVVIPYYYPSFHQLMGIQNSYYIEGLYEMFRIVENVKASVIMVKGSGENDDDASFSLDSLRKKERKEVNGVNNVIEISSGTTITICYEKDETYWNYIPYNYGQVSEREVEDTLSKMDLLDDNKNLKVGELIDILRKNGKDAKKKQLRKMYRMIAEGDLNANSLQLLSYSNIPIYDSNQSSCRESLPLFYNSYCRSVSCLGCTFSCLYTGDTNLKVDEKIELIKKIRSKYLKENLSIIQVPHHGSIFNYNPEITDLAHMAFVNYKPHTKRCSFHEGIYLDFVTEGIPLIPITDMTGYSMCCSL